MLLHNSRHRVKVTERLRSVLIVGNIPMTFHKIRKEFRPCFFATRIAHLSINTVDNTITDQYQPNNNTVCVHYYVEYPKNIITSVPRIGAICSCSSLCVGGTLGVFLTTVLFLHFRRLIFLLSDALILHKYYKQ